MWKLRNLSSASRVSEVWRAWRANFNVAAVLLSVILLFCLSFCLLWVAPVAAESETLPHIRAYCLVRHPDSQKSRATCETREIRAARALFELLENAERNSPAYRAGQQCIERSRLKLREKTKLQSMAVNWPRALECVESYFANAAGAAGADSAASALDPAPP